MDMVNWLPEHSAALQDLRARGLSYSEIADTINATFSTAYTRNAALSRAQQALRQAKKDFADFKDYQFRKEHWESLCFNNMCIIKDAISKMKQAGINP